MAKLIIRYPNNVIQEAEIDQPKYRIGSADDNDLVLDNEDVSPHQAEIAEEGGLYSILDVSENKSTRVNGKEIERSNIGYGDRIAFGPVTGLFYPAKKSKLAEKAKLSLYIGAGALVIILSIVFIFYLTSKQISTVVSQQIGEDFKPEEIVAEALGKERKTRLERREERGTEKLVQLKKVTKRGKLVLPEPDREIIEERTAVAIPRGPRRLFFRKIPVSIEWEAEEEKEVPIEEEMGEEEEGEAVIEEEASPLVEEEEKGFFTKLLSPVKRLISGEGKEPVLEEEIAPEEVVTAREPEELAPVPLAEDVKRAIEPLSILNRVDVAEVRESVFKEEPIYSEGELKSFEEESILGNIKISEAESINIDIVWKYPKGIEKLEPVIRAGAVLRIDDNKTIDYLFGTKNGLLIAIDGTTGEEIFTENLEKSFYEPIIEYIDDDKLKDMVIIFEDGDIVAYKGNLERLWYYEGKDKITSLPLLIDVNGDGTCDLVFPTLNMDIIAIDGSTGFEIWRFFDASSEIIFSPVAVAINDDSVQDIVFSTVDGFLYALDGKTGWSLWKREIFGKPAGPCSVGDLDGDKKYDIVTLTGNGILSSYKNDGKLLFTYDLKGRYNVAPSIGDTDGDKSNEIVLIDRNGVVRAIEGKTRREKWFFETEEMGALGRLALADIDTDGGLDVLFTTFSGLLFVLDGKTGAQVALYNYGAYIFTTPIVVDINRDKLFEIILGTYSGEVFALRVADIKKRFLSLKNSFWITSNHDYENSGYSPSYFIKKPWK